MLLRLQLDLGWVSFLVGLRLDPGEVFGVVRLRLNPGVVCFLRLDLTLERSYLLVNLNLVVGTTSTFVDICLFVCPWLWTLVLGCGPWLVAGRVLGCGPTSGGRFEI